jgi:hypothetical protein
MYFCPVAPNYFHNLNPEITDGKATEDPCG